MDVWWIMFFRSILHPDNNPKKHRLGRHTLILFTKIAIELNKINPVNKQCNSVKNSVQVRVKYFITKHSVIRITTKRAD